MPCSPQNTTEGMTQWNKPNLTLREGKDLLLDDSVPAVRNTTKAGTMTEIQHKWKVKEKVIKIKRLEACNDNL